jgi:hypothetical protein
LRLRRAMAAGELPNGADEAIRHGLERLARLLASPSASQALQMDVPERLRAIAAALGGDTTSAITLNIAASLRLIAVVVADHAAFFAVSGES